MSGEPSLNEVQQKEVRRIVYAIREADDLDGKLAAGCFLVGVVVVVGLLVAFLGPEVILSWRRL